jgi:hypothetical protein
LTILRLNQDGIHEARPAVEYGKVTTAKNSQSIFNIEPDMSDLLGGMGEEELRSFADMQEPDGDD